MSMKADRTVLCMGILTDGVMGGGCSCKIGPSDLRRIMCGISFPKNDRLIVGMDSPDDAGVFLISDDCAIIQTVDFFPPMVDDPFLFGRIAAANSLSDIYAMGGRPVTALNIFCFPVGKIGHEYAKEIIAGGAAALKEAECVLAGGHSLFDESVKYGLAVTGTAEPSCIKRKGGASVGDAVILTKPIGAGVVSTASKAGMASERQIRLMTDNMAFLNRRASEIMSSFHVSACTDITGFSLFGHLYECAVCSGCRIDVDMSAVPVLEGAPELASMGLMPAGLYRNRDFYSPHVSCMPIDSEAGEITYMMMFDPQTSGGLAIFVPESEQEEIVRRMNSEGVPAACIGHVSRKGEPGIDARI